jgi:predicted O-linked N-acetylglucosamine transferase (SPINDLY family)
MDKIVLISELIKKKKFDQAKINCQEILEKNLKNFEFLNIFAIVLFNLEEYEKSIEKWKLALKANSRYYEGYNNLGNALLNLKQYKDALINLNKAAELKSNNYELYNKIGIAYQGLNEDEKSLKFYNHALKIKKDYLPSIRNKFLLLKKINKYFEAIKELDKLLLYGDDKIKVYTQKGKIYSDLNNSVKVIENFSKVLSIDPEFPFLFGEIMNHKLKMCDWKNFDDDLEKIKKSVENNKKILPPFIGAILFDTPFIQLKNSRIWTKSIDTKENFNFEFYKKKNDKIKIGYFNANFRSHANGYLTNRLYDLHDRSKFEIFGFYFGPPLNKKDKLQNKIVGSFDKFIDISSSNILEVKKIVQKFNIDIAVDLMGHSGGDFNRFSIFLNKLAPIQICFLGFPCTTGSDSIDYLIADKTIIPEKFQKFYSEKIIYLPDTYQPNEEIKEPLFQFKSKKDLGLPEDKFIFCCFNGHQKIQPKIFKSWMKILNNKKDSVLWLLKDNDYSEANLKKNALDLGIDPERIIFGKKMEIDKHLARLKYADLFLDTYPYGAHTTCSNALRMNLPVITLAGETFASRVSASLLNTIMLNELIVYNIDDYEKLALKISNNSELLEKLKEKIKYKKNKSNLFKPKIFTENLEKAYIEVYQNYINGFEPRTIKL